MISASAVNKPSMENGEDSMVANKRDSAQQNFVNCEQPQHSEAEESDTEQKGFLRRASRLVSKSSSIDEMCSPLTPDGAQKKSSRRSKDTSNTREQTTSSSKSKQVTISAAVPPESTTVCKNTGDGSNAAIKSIPVDNTKWRIVHDACHSVLAVLRADPRYVSPARFTEELTVSEVYGHPLHTGLQELLQKLQAPQENPTFYLDVFCDAVRQDDVSAAVTGACLSALHKFLEYGYTDGITKIAESLIHCAFEESDLDDGNMLSRRRSAAAPSTRRLYRGPSQYFSQDTVYDNDEQVVHKLLALCVLTVKTALKTGASANINGLLHTCWHVRFASTASALLKHAAGSACQGVIVALFGDNNLIETKCAVIEKLAASLVSDNGSRYTTKEVVALQTLPLVISALECTHVVQSEAEIQAWNTITKAILELASTTTDCNVLAHCCRVLYLLLDVSHIKHLKCELEVFLQSVHLHRLRSNASDEEKEVLLESLLELCYGNKTTAPINATDLYLNYDCDGACTNVYEAVVQTLGKIACPYEWNNEDDEANVIPLAQTSSTAGTPPSQHERTSQQDHTGKADAASNTGNISRPLQTVTAHAPVTHLNRLALEGILSILDDIAQRCFDDVGDSNSSTGTVTESTAIPQDVEHPGTTCCISHGVTITEEELDLRKQKKKALAEVVQAFNTGNPDKGDWLQLAVTKGILETTDDSRAVAELFHKTHSFDKRRIGIYLSRGPVHKFPFHAKVRRDFAGIHDFAGLSFVDALRKYLSKFRLPGEAQCIDRLMEAFSKELYHQQGEMSFFKNSDAVYVLAFSTIMLNTDLHNPTIKTDKRMTKDQFVHNNRGINGGDNIPEDFLAELYDHIKANELQLRRDTSEFLMKSNKGDSKVVWEAILAKKEEVVSPIYLTSDSRTRRTRVHDKEMFLILANSCAKAISGIFVRSWDDALVVRTLQGLQRVVKVAAYFDLDLVVNDVLQVLLQQGRDYIRNCITLDQSSGMDGGASVGTPTNIRNASTESTVGEEETTLGGDTDHLIPFGLLCSSKERGEVDITGSASNRGLLALDSSFVLLRKNSNHVADSWPAFIECLSALRDCRALPAGLSDLDDFADSNGNVLPLSAFAKASQKRLDEYNRSLTERDSSKTKGWFRSFFRKGNAVDPNDADDDASIAPKSELSMYAKTLLNVAESADIEDIVQMGSSKLPNDTIRKLLNELDSYPFDNDPVGEQHAVFSLELAARALLSNRERSPELFLLFLSKFESVLCRLNGEEVPAPFVIERIVVTILRSCIHLYELPELRAHLRSSLQLILMTLPRNFIRVISDRMACGLAIILRASFHFFETHNEWTFMGDTLDLLANYNSSRVFVFDGIASTVEYSLPNLESQHSPKDSDSEKDNTEDRPQLSEEATVVLSRILTRFVLGFYQGDVSLSVPAMLCLEKVYRHKVKLLLQQQCKNDGSEASVIIDPISFVPDKDLWQNVAVAVYSVCRSTDPEASRDGIKCYRRIILRTAVDQITNEKWIAIMYLMVSKQPPTAAEISRSNTFSLLGHLLKKVMPAISYNKDNREDLEDLMKQTVALAEENLQNGRRGTLFESTLQTLTDISNSMVSDEFGGDKAFNTWASEMLLKELERFGNVGGKPATSTSIIEAEDVSEISDSVAEDDGGPILEATNK